VVQKLLSSLAMISFPRNTPIYRGSY